MKGSFYMMDIYEMGLTSIEAKKRLKENGENRLESGKKQSVVMLFLSQFKDVMVLILLAATVISAFMGEVYDALTMIAIVLMDAVLGFVQEYKTEKTLEALETMTAPMATVIRDGKKQKIDASELVVGDVFLLEAGDRVPADGRIISQSELMCDESMLTGESEAVNKTDFTYMGTAVTKGTAVCEVINTGMLTEMGKVSKLIDEAGDDKTPLQKKLGKLGVVLSIICIGVCLVVAAAGILRGEPIFDMLMIGITIAIAAIPEGLPATVTIALALAVRRMLKQKALVHKLHSVETLGCTTVICTDKTGTLTQNKMTVTSLWASGKDYSFTGGGKSFKGDLLCDERKTEQNSAVNMLLKCAVLCNNAVLPSLTQNEMIGDPTEVALLAMAAKCGVTKESLKSYLRLSEMPFDSETKMMSVKEKYMGKVMSFSKGACDVILNRCNMIMAETGAVPLTNRFKKEVFEQADRYAENALRVLAFSFTGADGQETFLGIVGMQDPPRKEARRAVTSCKKAGIKVVMITGDHKLTAAAIARQVGLLEDGDKVISSEELRKLSDEEFRRQLRKISVFARVSPEDKLRIVSAYKALGETVAMTGDGVNDAAAIKEADIGVAMGLSGTDVSKQAADIILMDDNFATLCAAVKQGRTIYSNIRKFVRYLISCNIGEVMVMFLSIVLGMPVVLLPTQILLVNLVTDGLPAIALGLEKSEESIMRRRPQDFSGDFFSKGLLRKIITRGILIGLCTLGCFTYLLQMGVAIETARTAALVTLIMSQLIHVFECRSEEKSIFALNPFGNKALIWSVLASALALAASIYLVPLQSVMQTVALSGHEMLISLAFAAAVPIVSGIVQLFARRR